LFLYGVYLYKQKSLAQGLVTVIMYTFAFCFAYAGFFILLGIAYVVFMFLALVAGSIY